MTSPLLRTLELERGSIDLETGEFPMVLATQGEASDGHILNIRGGNVPAKMPLQINHANSPAKTIGSIFDGRRGTKNGLPVLRATGQIELGGEGTGAAIRRDLAFMISEGHIGAVSLRAQGDKVIRRTDLPKEHFAHVGADEPDPRRRYGLFFERFTALEGSIVALPADRGAIIGRAEETEGEVQEFWRSLAEDAPAPQEPEIFSFSTIETKRDLERFLRDVGASRSEAKRLVALVQPPRDAEEQVEPLARPEPEDFVRDARKMIRAELAGLKEETFKECSALLKRALGRID